MVYKAILGPKAVEQIRDWGLPDHVAPFVSAQIRAFLEDPDRASREPPSPPFAPVGRIHEFSITEDPFRYFFRIHFFYGPENDQVTITAAVMHPHYQLPPAGARPGVTSP